MEIVIAIIRSHAIAWEFASAQGESRMHSSAPQWGDRRRNGPSRAQGSMRTTINVANDPSRQEYSAGVQRRFQECRGEFRFVGGKGFYVLCDLVTSAGDL